MEQEQYFDVPTYATWTTYVPMWRGNREAKEKGKIFFEADIMPCNDAEYQAMLSRLHHEQQEAEARAKREKVDYTPPTDAAEMEIMRNRVRLRRLRLPCNDGSVLIPKTGKDIVDGGGRDKLSNVDFASLCRELVLASVDQSTLAAGELKASGSSPELPAPETRGSGNGTAVAAA